MMKLIIGCLVTALLVSVGFNAWQAQQEARMEEDYAELKDKVEKAEAFIALFGLQRRYEGLTLYVIQNLRATQCRMYWSVYGRGKAVHIVSPPPPTPKQIQMAKDADELLKMGRERQKQYARFIEMLEKYYSQGTWKSTQMLMDGREVYMEEDYARRAEKSDEQAEKENRRPYPTVRPLEYP